MKVITITQPWATLIAIGAKKIETRSWSTNYRGPLAIHAAKGFPQWAKYISWTEPFYSILCEEWKPYVFHPYNLPFGVIIATCVLAECHSTRAIKACHEQGLRALLEQEQAFGDFTDNRYGFVLKDVCALNEPIPAKGTLGLWEFPVEDYLK